MRPRSRSATLYPWKVKEFAEEERGKGIFTMLDRDITRVLSTVLIATTICNILSDRDLHGSGSEKITRLPTLHLPRHVRFDGRDFILRRAHPEDDRGEQRRDDGALALPSRGFTNES